MPGVHHPPRPQRPIVDPDRSAPVSKCGAIVEQAIRFDALAPNMIVKIPATRAGIDAIEQVTALGISINATVSFTVPQCLAVADAVERGLQRREADGHDVSPWVRCARSWSAASTTG